MTCECGHQEDEHDGACVIWDCRCPFFESNGEDDRASRMEALND